MVTFVRSCLVSVVTTASLLGCSGARNTHELLNSVLWMQTSAEYHVFSKTAYKQAREALDKALHEPTWTATLEQGEDLDKLPPAVILDLDETVLDNTSFEGRLIRSNTSYNRDQWEEWVQQAVAPAVPGSLEFLEYARSRGVAIFFVTNRSGKHEESTRKNLQRLGIALPPEMDTVLSVGERPYNWPADKASRRSFLANQYRILLLIGDDLGDFVSGAVAAPEDRIRLAQQYDNRWGVSWFLIPNPNYGSWESSLYVKGLADAEILKAKRAIIRDLP